MSGPGTPSNEPRRASENYRPPSARGRLIAIIAALLIITNVITGLSAFYLAQPTVSTAALCPGNAGSAKAPAATVVTSSLGTDSSSSQFTFHIDPPFKPTAATVTVVGPWAGPEAEPFLRVLENFTRLTGTPVTYKNIRQEDLTQILPTQFASGTAPGDLVVKISKISGIRTPIVSGDGVGWPLSAVTEHFIATYGGAAMHRALMNKTKAWTAPDVRTIFADRLVPLLAGKCFSEPLEWNTVALTNWWGGLHALYFMGSWITGLVSNATDLGVFSLPAESGITRGIVFAGDYFFVPKYTANPTEANQLAEWLAGHKGQE